MCTRTNRVCFFAVSQRVCDTDVLFYFFVESRSFLFTARLVTLIILSQSQKKDNLPFYLFTLPHFYAILPSVECRFLPFFRVFEAFFGFFELFSIYPVLSRADKKAVNFTRILVSKEHRATNSTLSRADFYVLETDKFRQIM